MITDIHRHYVPPVFFDFLKSRSEFQVRVKREEGEGIDLDIRGMHFGLNKTFFDLTRQVEGATGQGNQNDLTLHFGLGNHKDPVRLDIRWTDGTRQELDTAVDRIITVRASAVGSSRK